MCCAVCRVSSLITQKPLLLHVVKLDQCYRECIQGHTNARSSSARQKLATESAPVLDNFGKEGAYDTDKSSNPLVSE